MAVPTFASMAAGYRAMWKSMRITRAAACDQAARRILAARARYLAVEKQVGVPWFVQGIWHMRESSNNFAGVLHNGEHIIGTGRKTHLVPAGRGPFSSWEQAAIDALRMKGLHNVKEWPIERIGYETERFNGFGYVARRVNSPYVWAGSNHYTVGKYVADGVFSMGHVDTQLGCLPVLAALCKISPEVNERVNGKPSVVRDIIKSVTPPAVPTVAVGVDQGWGFTEWAIAALVVAAVAGLAIYLIRKYRQKEPTNLSPVIDDQSAEPIARGGAATEETQ
jgi:lysozyme family protein